MRNKKGLSQVKSFDQTFSIGEIKDFSMEFRYAELPTVEQGSKGQSPLSTSADVETPKTSEKAELYS